MHDTTETSVKVVALSAEAFQAVEIVTGLVAAAIAEITGSQSQGIQRISVTLEELEHITTHTEQAASQNAATADMLHQESNDLNLPVFNLRTLVEGPATTLPGSATWMPRWRCSSPENFPATPPLAL